MSNAAIDAIEKLHTELLGNSFGKFEGEYGAGGGGIHVFYLGRDREGSLATWPTIDELLRMLRLETVFKPPSMRWFTTLDPLHQDLFPRTMNEISERLAIVSNDDEWQVDQQALEEDECEGRDCFA
ncbi:MAG: hypothetical protein MJA30_05150 [Cytophagales bacterium]|nr:hypothetical protein [Cytophagales bacterium]